MVSATWTAEQMLGKNPESLLLLFFLFQLKVKDQKQGLEKPMQLESLSIICPSGFLEPQRLESLVKYSISFLTSDPTVPLVPTATGLDATIFSGELGGYSAVAL